MRIVKKEGEGFQPVALVLETRLELNVIKSLTGSVVGVVEARDITDKAYDLLGGWGEDSPDFFYGELRCREK